MARALRKEPKYYLWDWSQVEDSGARAENFVASALLKAVHWWTETGQGEFGLYFVRDKQKREVDFLVTRDNSPWFLVEVKSSERTKLSSSLAYFQRQTQTPHAFQVAFDMDFVERDCFEFHEPIIRAGENISRSVNLIWNRQRANLSWISTPMFVFTSLGKFSQY